MRVAITIRYCRHYGSSRYVIDTTKFFVKHHEVHVFTNNWDPMDPQVIIHKIPAFTKNQYIYEASFSFLATLIHKFHKFDVTLAQPTRYFTPMVAEMQFVYKAWADYRRNNKLQLTLGDVMNPLIEKYNIERVKEVITISDIVKQEVLKYYKIPQEKIHVIHSGVDIKEFDPKHKSKFSQEIKEKYSIKDELVLLFIGNPFQRKGLQYLIEAMPLMNEKKVKLLILGRDDPRKYLDVARKLKIEDKLIFVGLTKGVKKYYSTADLFVLPTLYEPFGLVITEAMASGLPVITSKIAGAAEIIEDSREGLLLKDPKNPEEIAEKINYLLDNNLLHKIGNNARKKIEKYTWKTTAKKMLEVFELASKS